MHKGRCECGQVAFEIEGPLEPVTVCHCGQCRRSSGHAWATTVTTIDALNFTCDTGLAWYASSDTAKRGFCRECGSSLFFRFDGKERIAVSAGCLESPTGLSVEKHIFVRDKGDYYTIDDGKPQIQSF